MVVKKNNIVSLGARTKQAQGHTELERASVVVLDMPPSAAMPELPAPLNDVLQNLHQELFKLLSQFFNQADDLLFEQANNSGSNLEQSSYFESMRTLRLERGNIVQQLLLVVREQFKSLSSLSAVKTPDSSIYEQELFLDDVSLMNDDALEEEVAINAMVSRCLESQRTDLEHLKYRFCQLLAREPKNLELSVLALHPEAISKKFLQQLTAFSLTIKTKLILLKSFERAVILHYPALCQAVNQRLAQQGVLPDLSQQLRRQQREIRQQSRQASDAQARVSQEAAPVSGGASASGIEKFLNSVDFSNLDAGDDNSVLDTDMGDLILPELDVPSLNKLLSGIQSQGPNRESLQGQSLFNYLQPMITEHGQVSALNQKLINLVNMLFEYIWEDPNLAEPMRSLLSRMQIPLLKVALVDESFFGSGKHPARQLLNEMARAALSWEEPENFKVDLKKHDALYQMLDGIVQRVLSEFDHDVSLFSSLLAQLKEFSRKEQHRAKLLAQRTVDMAKGEAKSEEARQFAHQAIDTLLEHYRCPLSLHDLLHQAWVRCLHLAILKHGHSSPAWKQQLQLAESICHSVQALCQHVGPKKQTDLQRLGQLLAAVRKQLSDVGYDEFQLKPLFNRLAVDCKRIREVELEPESAVQLQSDVPELTEEVTVEPANAETAQRPDVVVKPNPAPLAASTVAPANKARKAIAQNFVDQAKGLKQGAWFEFQEGDVKRRCRLAAVVSGIGRYIFVDRLGKKLLELDVESLAADLERGTLRILDDGMLFDRALESVIGDLRDSRKTKR